MSYTYQNSLSNKLLAVNEVSLGSTNNYLGDFTDANTAVNDYSYDGNGNLIEDKNKGIGSIGYNHLNLPQQISVPAKGNITYNYDASGAKLSKTVTEGSSVKTTLYLGDMVFENDVFLFAGHEEGRLRKAASVSGEANNQNAIWDDAAGNSIDIVNRRVNRPGNFGTTGTNGNYALSITKNTGGIGAGKLLKVMSGDIVYSSVDYFYHNNYADNSSANGLGSILNHIAGVIAGTRSPAGTAVKSANGAAAGNLGADGLFTGLFAPQSPSGGYTYQPKAYMHILLFDEQFKFDAANSYVVQVSAWVQESRQTLYGSASAKKNGYAYIYFSNESNDVVFFDNFNLTHQAGPLLEETHYYPFGLTMGGVSSKATGALENDKKYNGIELNEDLGLGTYDAFYRTLDPQIGRWWQIDPKVENMEAWSPFVSNFNSPFRFNDPLGDEPCCEEVWKDIKSAAKETATSVYNGAVSVARTFNTYLNPIASIVEVVTGKSTESDFTVAKPRSISGMEAAIAIIPGAKLEGSLIKAGEKIVVAALEKYEVGSADKLLSKSVKGDGLDVHHVSQSKPTSQIIADYDKKTAPAIALTQAEHKAIPTLKGTATAGNAREQLAKDIKDLRKHTNAPNSSLQNLIDLNKKTYPNAFKK